VEAANAPVHMVKALEKLIHVLLDQFLWQVVPPAYPSPRRMSHGHAGPTKQNKNTERIRHGMPLMRS
jgi:hypothetical protein